MSETNQFQREPSTYNSQNSDQRYGQNINSSPSYDQNFSAPQFNSQQPRDFSSPKLKSGLAITSMVFGCVGVLLCWGMFGLLSIPGLIMGIAAVVKANKKPHEYGGKGFAIAGVVINGLLVLLVPFIAAIAIPNLLAARRSANEGSAIASIRTLMKAESDFMKSGVAKRCGDLNDLVGAKMIDNTLADGEKSGYKFAISKTAEGSCEMFATPLVSAGVSATGTRSFYASTSEWEIRAANKNGLPANKNDKPLETSSGSRRNSAADDDY